eukprot:s4642_g2.t1
MSAQVATEAQANGVVRPQEEGTQRSSDDQSLQNGGEMPTVPIQTAGEFLADVQGRMHTEEAGVGLSLRDFKLKYRLRRTRCMMTLVQWKVRLRLDLLSRRRGLAWKLAPKGPHLQGTSRDREAARNWIHPSANRPVEDTHSGFQTPRSRLTTSWFGIFAIRSPSSVAGMGLQTGGSVQGPADSEYMVAESYPIATMASGQWTTQQAFAGRAATTMDAGKGYPKGLKGGYPTTTPSSSSIPAEAIQAEVQRQMGNLLTRLPEVENDNARLQLELHEERLKGAAPAASAGQPSAPLPLSDPGEQQNVIEALAESMRQFQELQMKAMIKSIDSEDALEVVKTALAVLPALGQPEGDQCGLSFQDWIVQAVKKAVVQAYTQWLGSSPLERLGIGPEGTLELVSGKWVRINARSCAMIVQAIPEAVKIDLIARRSTQSMPLLLFRIYTLYQPGGAGERTTIVQKLQGGQQPKTVDECLQQLTAWPRWVQRCRDMGMAVPDGSVLAKGLTLLTSNTINQVPDAMFRTQLVRATLRIDQQPPLPNVLKYQRHLQAEVESLASSALELIAKLEDQKLQALKDATAVTKGKIREAVIALNKSWFDHLVSYCGSGIGTEALKGLQHLNRRRRKTLWSSRQWVVHLYAGKRESAEIMLFDSHPYGGWYGQSEKERALVNRHTGLFVKMIYLHALATARRTVYPAEPNDVKEAGFMLEQPKDLRTYLLYSDPLSQDCTSFWRTSLWEEYSAEAGLTMVSFDMSSLGKALIRQKSSFEALGWLAGKSAG